MMFRVGQKVVCICDYPSSRRRAGAVYVEQGAVYTIRSMDMWRDRLLLRFCELRNDISEYGIEYGFNAVAFRPVVERKTDISCFTALLQPNSKILEGVDV